MNHVHCANSLSAGVKALPAGVQAFPHTQAMWLSNPRVNPKELAQPLREAARDAVGRQDGEWALGHTNRPGRRFSLPRRFSSSRLPLVKRQGGSVSEILFAPVCRLWEASVSMLRMVFCPCKYNRPCSSFASFRPGSRLADSTSCALA